MKPGREDRPIAMTGTFHEMPQNRILRVASPEDFQPAMLDENSDAVVVLRGGRGPAAGSPSRARMRAVLFNCGFLPVDGIVDKDRSAESLTYFRSSLVRDPALVGITSADHVAMSDLGFRGRFGNQLFQYAFLKLYALRNHAVPRLPPWTGEQIFGVKEARAEPGHYPRLVFEDRDNDDLQLWEDDLAPVNVDFSGYFQELPPSWKAHRAFLRRLLTVRPEWREALAPAISALKKQGRTLLCVHIRCFQDYDPTAPHINALPPGLQRDFVKAIWPRLENPVLHVATDGGRDILDMFADFPALAMPTLPPGMPVHLGDFLLMQSADVLGITNSSFSRMASLLADDAQRCFIVGPSGAEAYRPWDDRAFWARFDPGVKDVQAFRLARAYRKTLSLRLQQALAEHKRPAGGLTAVASSDPVACKACGAPALLFGVCDFSQVGEGRPSPPLSGQPVFYRRCRSCRLVFTDGFDDWPVSDLQRVVYNEGFFSLYADFLMTRPAERANRLLGCIDDPSSLTVFDVGALNFMTAETLRAGGFAAVGRYDYFDPSAHDDGAPPADIVTCFDLLERTPEPAAMIEDLAKRAKPGGVVIFNAATQTGTETNFSDLNIAPRAGQICCFSPDSLRRLWSPWSFQVKPLGEGWYAASRTPPPFLRSGIEAGFGTS